MVHGPHPPGGGSGQAAPGRPRVQVAEVFRRHGDVYQARHALTPAQGKVLRALTVCRTAALGGHLEVCTTCGHERPAYNSCRNRHCPGCQAMAQHAWLEQRLARVLPTHHFHVVFTLPEELRRIALRNGAVVYDVLIRAAADVLTTLGEQRLGARIGITTVLHTWTRQMLLHPHVHCVVTGGGLALDGSRWVPTPRHFLFPVAVLRKLFRGAVRTRLLAAFDQGRLDLAGACADLAEPRAFRRMLRGLHRKKWVVYAKAPFAGPKQVFAYLGRYTHRVAISDHRMVAVSDDAVTFRTKDGATTTVAPDEFIRRFLLHVLPDGFHKIRHYGLYAAAHVHRGQPVARALLGASDVTDPADHDHEDDPGKEDPEAELTGRDPRRCPACGDLAVVCRPLPSPTPHPDDTS